MDNFNKFVIQEVIAQATPWARVAYAVLIDMAYFLFPFFGYLFIEDKTGLIGASLMISFIVSALLRFVRDILKSFGKLTDFSIVLSTLATIGPIIYIWVTKDRAEIIKLVSYNKQILIAFFISFFIFQLIYLFMNYRQNNKSLITSSVKITINLLYERFEKICEDEVNKAQKIFSTKEKDYEEQIDRYKDREDKIYAKCEHLDSVNH